MPTLHLAYCPASTEPEARQLASQLTELTARLLRKRADLTLVQLQRVDALDWWVGAARPAATGLAGYRLRIDISQGSNSGDEIAGFIEAVHNAMGRLLGALHPASYVVVQEQPMAHWGWSGRSQAARLAASASPV
jgi:4-oxalocrotonate tautomerase